MKSQIIGMTFLSLIFFLGACGAQSTDTPVSGDIKKGKKLYEQYCILCHGTNGKMQLNGATDITKSVMTYDERRILIKDGKNLMTPFDGILSEREIEDIAAYSMKFKKQ